MKTNYVFGKTKLFTINRKTIKIFLYANLLKVTILLVLFLTSSSAFSQNTIVPDSEFEQALINQGYDSGPIDGVVPTNNINTITSLFLNSSIIFVGNIMTHSPNYQDLTGIEDFTALTELIIWNSPNITTLDVSQNINLERLSVTHSSLTTLDVSQNVNLEHFSISESYSMTSIDITNNPLIKTLSIWNIPLVNVVNLTNNIALESLTLSYVGITSLDLSNNIALGFVEISGTSLMALDLSQNTSVSYLDCHNNQLASLNILNCSQLQAVYAGNNNLIYLDASNLPELDTLWVEYNQLIALDIRGYSPQLPGWIAYSTYGNPNLTCIYVDDVSIANTWSYFYKESFSNFTSIRSTVVSPMHVSCNGGSDGSASINITGGSSTGSYQWSNTQTTNPVVNLSAGIHSCIITDMYGCDATVLVTINEPTPLNVNVIQNGLDLQANVLGGTPNYTYLWSPNGEVTQSITSTVNGIYDVVVTDANGCQEIESFNVTNTTTSINNMSAENFKVYPNPSTGILNIEFNSDDINGSKINVYNLSGELVYSDNRTNHKGKYTKKIDLTNNAKGIYFLEIETDNRSINKKLMLK